MSVFVQQSYIVVSGLVQNIGRIASSEIVQVYVANPVVPGVVTPLISLQGFTKIPLQPDELSPFSFVISSDQLSTVLNDGSRTLVHGTYTITIGGHQANDPRGQLIGNTLTQSVVLF
jgi:beta-glucosidase